VKIQVGETEHSLIVTFKTKSDADQAQQYGLTFKDRRLNISFYQGPSAQSIEGKEHNQIIKHRTLSETIEDELLGTTTATQSSSSSSSALMPNDSIGNSVNIISSPNLITKTTMPPNASRISEPEEQPIDYGEEEDILLGGSTMDKEKEEDIILQGFTSRSTSGEITAATEEELGSSTSHHFEFEPVDDNNVDVDVDDEDEDDDDDDDDDEEEDDDDNDDDDIQLLTS